MAMCLAAECICNHISLAWMIVHFQIVIFYQLKPTSLPHIQICLREDILEALMVRIDITLGSHKMLSPDLKCMNHGCKLKIMSGVILFMIPKCTGGIYNYSVVLHKYTTNSDARSITIDVKWLGVVWLS